MVIAGGMGGAARLAAEAAFRSGAGIVRLYGAESRVDALISRRVYKPAFSHAQSLEIMRQGRGTHFDPDVLDAFFAVEEDFARIAQTYRDAEDDAEHGELARA